MGFIDSFDHWKVGDNLDFASWDSYPIGFVERFPFSDAERLRYGETSHPDIAPFHHDLYRGVGRGRFWVMEQQPGPVNWAPYNPAPAPGMVKLWTLEAHAHGADVVSYFRWRQAHFGQEQMHAGLNLPHGNELSPGGREAREAAQDLTALGPLGPSQQAPVALVFDYEGFWTLDIQRQGASFAPYEAMLRWYEAIRRLGQDIDIVRPGASLKGYRLALAPVLPIVTEAMEHAFAEADGLVLFGARAGSKTPRYAIPSNLPPGPLAESLRLRVTEVSSLRPGVRKPVAGAVSGFAERWTERIEAKSEILARFADGSPALAGDGQRLYAAFWPEQRTLEALMHYAAERAGLTIQPLPPDVRRRRRGEHVFYFNYGSEPWTAPEGEETFVVGRREIPARGYAVSRPVA
jgi:beta-galactosidase